MFAIGRIKREMYAEIALDITTEDVIITQERIDHSNLHMQAFDKFKAYIPEMLMQPDIIFADKKPNTAILIKRIDVDGLNLELVLRLHVATDQPAYKNSILSFWHISENRRQNYERNKQIIYRKPEL